MLTPIQYHDTSDIRDQTQRNRKCDFAMNVIIIYYIGQASWNCEKPYTEILTIVCITYHHYDNVSTLLKYYYHIRYQFAVCIPVWILSSLHSIRACFLLGLWTRTIHRVPDLGQCEITSDTWPEIERENYIQNSQYKTI